MDPADARAPYWLLVRGDSRDGRRLELFTVDYAAGKTLLVFGSESEAETFLHSRASEGYRTRETWAAELMSALSGSAFGAGPCAGVERVTLNPLSESADGEEASESLACVGRRVFVERLMGRGPSRTRSG